MRIMNQDDNNYGRTIARPVSLSGPRSLPLDLFFFSFFTHSVFYKDLWYSVAQSMRIKREGSAFNKQRLYETGPKPSRTVPAGSPASERASVELSSSSLTRTGMQIERRNYISRYFPNCCFTAYVGGRAAAALPRFLLASHNNKKKKHPNSCVLVSLIITEC